MSGLSKKMMQAAAGAGARKTLATVVSSSRTSTSGVGNVFVFGVTVEKKGSVGSVSMLGSGSQFNSGFGGVAAIHPTQDKIALSIQSNSVPRRIILFNFNPVTGIVGSEIASFSKNNNNFRACAWLPDGNLAAGQLTGAGDRDGLYRLDGSNFSELSKSSDATNYGRCMYLTLTPSGALVLCVANSAATNNDTFHEMSPNDFSLVRRTRVNGNVSSSFGVSEDETVFAGMEYNTLSTGSSFTNMAQRASGFAINPVARVMPLGDYIVTSVSNQIRLYRVDSPTSITNTQTITLDSVHNAIEVVDENSFVARANGVFNLYGIDKVGHSLLLLDSVTGLPVNTNRNSAGNNISVRLL